MASLDLPSEDVMTELAYSIFTAHRRNPENDIALQVIDLFERFPGLTAFTVGKDEPAGSEAAEQTLAIRNVSFGDAKKDDEGEVRLRIRDVLAQFVQERPGMLELLSGRTFSRTLHQLLDTRALQAQQRAA
jgi:hypothetical protein